MQRHFVPKDRIREIVYPGSGHEAFEKMFERDKDDLRSLGVPVEVGQMDRYFDDEPGYRIRPDELQLPQVELTADEAQVIALATRVWEHARLAEATTEAVRKLTAYGLPLDVSALDIAQPRLTVAGEIPSASAVSSIVMRPKNRHSTIRPCRRSCCSRRRRESSRAIKASDRASEGSPSAFRAVSTSCSGTRGDPPPRLAARVRLA